MSEKTEARSYSATAKEELCRIEPENVCCLLAELSGIVSSAGSVLIRPGGGRRLFVETENEAVAARTVRLLRGIGIGSGAASGRVCIVNTLSDLESSFNPGEAAASTCWGGGVSPMTSPHANAAASPSCGACSWHAAP